MEIGTKNRCVIEATHGFAKKAQERLNLELFRNVSVHKFYRLKALITLEQVNTTEWSGKKYVVVNSHCMQMGLVMSMRFIFGHG